MTKYFNHIFPKITLILVVALVSLQAMADRTHSRMGVADSVSVQTHSWDEMSSGKMAQSAYPVKLKVKGNSLRVSTKHQQVLPIYTQGGSLYLAMRLTPGVNWLNGLPRGRYRINNRTINIR